MIISVGANTKMKLLLLAIIILIDLSYNNLVNCTFVPYQEIPRHILNGAQELKRSSNTSREFKQAFKEIGTLRKKLYDKTFCKSCHLVFTEIIEYRRNAGADREAMRVYFNRLCNQFAGWGVVACKGYIDIELDTALYIIDNKNDLSPEKICFITFQQQNCKDAPGAKRWTVEIPARNASAKMAKHKKILGHKNDTPWNVLQLTDFHYDPLYKPGSNAKCDLSLCCQAENGKPSKEENKAGYWGDYNFCDTPWHSITNFMDHVTKKQHFDFMYYTGDIISHRSWATTKDHNVGAIKKLYQLFADSFKVPIYPILGNHEPNPTDFFSPGNVTENVSTQWVFDLVATEWSRWLPESTKATILIGGYYTTLAKPGLRLIALNSNVCYTSNLWLLYRDEDPYDQLKWLVKVLSEAEKQGERVHILSHIPPGEIQCLQRWATQYRRIINRFAPIISAQFNGHTHLDEFRVFFDPKNQSRAINVAFNGGSFTTYVGLNPNYRLYSVDSKNFNVLDYNHFTFDLAEANSQPGKKPDWVKLYSFKRAYGMKKLGLSDFENLLKRMSTDQYLLKTYFRNQVRASEPFMRQGCNAQCLSKLFCAITALDSKSANECNYYMLPALSNENEDEDDE